MPALGALEPVFGAQFVERLLALFRGGLLYAFIAFTCCLLK
jgi:hypothetical protein